MPPCRGTIGERKPFSPTVLLCMFAKNNRARRPDITFEPKLFRCYTHQPGNSLALSIRPIMLKSRTGKALLWIVMLHCTDCSRRANRDESDCEVRREFCNCVDSLWNSLNATVPASVPGSGDAHAHADIEDEETCYLATRREDRRFVAVTVLAGCAGSAAGSAARPDSANGAA